MKSKFFIFIFFFFIFSSFEGSSQTTAFSYIHTLEEVHYEGIVGSNYITITSDSGSDFIAPHFTIGGLKKPVGYVSGTKAKAKAVFSTNCPNNFYVRGTGPRVGNLLSSKIRFPSKKVTPVGGIATYSAEEADIPFINDIIKCYDQFEVDWEISDNDTTWQPIGKSVNRLYVTHKKPDASLAKIYHTVIDVSCHEAGGLSGSNKDIVDEIYEEAYEIGFFGGFPGVKRASDGHTLTYYVNAPPGITCAGSVEDMLLTGDGRCGAWAELLRQMIKVQGIPGSETGALFPRGTINASGAVPMSPTEILAVQNAVNTKFPLNLGFNIWLPWNHFLVKNWGSVSIGDLIELPLANNLSDDINGYETAKSDYGLSGISGQGDVPDPRSIFLNHAVVFFDGNTYDPSYGTKYTGVGTTGITSLEDASLDGVRGCIVRVIENSTSSKFYFYVSEVNTSALDLQYFSIP